MSTPSDRPGDEAAPASDGGAGNGGERGEAASGERSSEEHAGRRALAWRGVKYLAYGVGGLLLAVVMLVVVVLLLLQTEWGARQAKHLILAQVNPLGTEAHPARLKIDDIDGNWISHLKVKGLRLVRPRQAGDEALAEGGNARRDSVRTMVQVDSLQAGYRLFGLLDHRIDLSDVQVYGPTVRMAQQPDGGWDLLQPFAAGPPDTTASPWQIRLDSVWVKRGAAQAAFYTQSGADSTLRVHGLNVSAADIDLGGSAAPRLDVRTFTAQFTPPGQTLERRLALSAALEKRKLTLRRLDLDSPYSDVSGRGTLVLPDGEQGFLQGGPARNIDFRLKAEPLSFRDLAGFVSGIDPERSVRLDLRAEGTSEKLQTHLDATFSDGATADVSGSLAPGLGGEAMAYDLEGQVRGFDPGFLSPGSPAGQVNGDVSVDLSGASAQELSGTLNAKLFDTRFSTYRLDRTTLAARFDDGTITLDARTGLDGATLTAAGTVQPFADPRAYDLHSTFQNVDLGRLTDTPGQSSDLDGQIAFQGYGTSLADANVTAQLALDGSRINQFAVSEGRFNARLIDGKLNLDARVRSPKGKADVEGRVQLTEDPLRYRISEGRVEGLDVAALTGDTTRSSLTGTFRLQGRGTNPRQDLRLDVADLQLHDSYYGSYVINSTHLNATLAGGRLDLNGQADLDGGAFDLAGATLYPFRPVPSYRVERASFANVDLGRLTGNPDPSSDLNGHISLEGSGFQPETMALRADAHLSDSRLNRQSIDSADVDVTLRDGQLAYTGSLSVPNGRTRLAGTMQPFSENPSLQIREGTFSGLDVGALAGIEGLNTNLQGRILALEGTLPSGGFSLDALDANAAIDLSGSTINEATVDSGRVQVRSNTGRVQLSTLLQFAEGGRADLDAHADLTGEKPSYRAEGTIDSVNVGALMGDAGAGANLTIALDLEGTGTDPRAMTLRGDVNAHDTRVADLRLHQLALRFALDDGAVRVDTLRLRSNVADANGAGTLALFDPPEGVSSDFRFTAGIDSLGPVRPFLSDSLKALAIGENHFQGRVMGRPSGVLRVEAEGQADGVVYNDMRVSDFEGTARAALAGGLALENVQSAQVHSQAHYLATSDLDVRAAGLDATYNGETVDLEGHLKIDERRDVQLAGVLDPRPQHQRLRLDTLDVRFGPDRWQLLQDATITYGDQYRISTLLLYTEDQQLAVDGVVDLDGEQDLVLTLENFRIGAVADLLNYDGLDGAVSGSIDLTGPAAAPKLDGRLDLDIESGGDPVGTLKLDLGYADQRLALDARLAHQDGSTLTAEGYLPLDLRLQRPAGAGSRVAADSARADEASDQPPAPGDFVKVAADTTGVEEVSLHVQADSFAVGWVKPFLNPDQVERIDGRLMADIDIGGTMKSPRAEGTATLTGGLLDLKQLGTTYHDIRATARLTGDQVRLRETVLKSGGGRLTARGTVDLQALTLGKLDIALTADDFRAVGTDGYTATVSGDLQFQGTTEAPVLKGTLSVQSADLYLDAFGAGNTEYQEVSLTEQDVRALRENFGVTLTEADTTTSDFYRALAMDLDVRMKRDTWLRSTSNPEMNVQFEGDLDLQKEAQQDLQLFGSIKVVPERSRVVQFGKRFDITEGVLTFNGNPGNPALDLSAAYDVSARGSRGNEVTITLAVSGRLDDLDFELGSNPSMETTDVLSYLATGRPADKSFVGGGGGGAQGLATGAALSQVTNYLEGIAGESLGLDIVEIEQDPQRGTLLTAGKYIYIAGVPNPLFIAVSQPINTGSSSSRAGAVDENNPTEVTLEYELIHGLLLRLLRRDALRLNLRLEYAY